MANCFLLDCFLISNPGACNCLAGWGHRSCKCDLSNPKTWAGKEYEKNIQITLNINSSNVTSKLKNLNEQILSITYFNGMGEKVAFGAIKVFFDPGVPGLNPLVWRPFNHAAGLGQPHDLDKVWHVPHKVVVDTLLVQHQNHVNLKKQFGNRE